MLLKAAFVENIMNCRERVFSNIAKAAAHSGRLAALKIHLHTYIYICALVGRSQNTPAKKDT